MSWRSKVKDLVATRVLPGRGPESVLLTFDDGPHAQATPAVLDVLARYDARAVFFVVGSRVHRAPHLLKRIVEQGHVLGNHSFEHPLGAQPGPIRYYRDVERCQAMVERWSGTRPRLFRPPLGQLSVSSLLAPRFSGLTPVLWSVDSNDWRMRHPDDIPATADRLMKALSGHPLRDIILFHDENAQTASLLEAVLPQLAARGVDLYSAVELLVNVGDGDARPLKGPP